MLHGAIKCRQFVSKHQVDSQHTHACHINTSRMNTRRERENERVRERERALKSEVKSEVRRGARERETE